MPREEPDPNAERGRPDTEELANPQPDLARPENDAPRRTADDSVYSPGEGAPPDDPDEADDSGQQVIGELRERKQEDEN